MEFVDLLINYENNNNISNPKKIFFDGVDGFDVYNVTAPFINNHETIIAGRVEKRNSEDSMIVFFKRINENHYVKTNYNKIRLQDPFISFVFGKIIVGGVHISRLQSGGLTWHTNFYIGSDLDSLTFWFSGPEHMKDIRISEMPNNNILVLTRPQSGEKNLGKIGFFVSNSLSGITSSRIENAPLLNNNFSDNIWGGPNQIISIKNGKALVLGHIARRKKDGKLQYCSLLFRVNINEGTIENPKIVATRKDFLPSPKKRNDLYDVVFSSGYDPKEKKIYVGVSDTESQIANVDLESIGKI
ncbi:DUF1861 family protein [Oenococcus alcoholitolerans]|uniref:DUF1861 family protein n=1 Tax=Oenococcus alcoholitolerans TaxID=931074 RepID=UPI003F70FD64